MRIVDQRLDPGAWYPNGSHTSLASFRDDYDYSRRVLHVRLLPSIIQKCAATDNHLCRFEIQITDLLKAKTCS